MEWFPFFGQLLRAWLLQPRRLARQFPKWQSVPLRFVPTIVAEDLCWLAMVYPRYAIFNRFVHTMLLAMRVLDKVMSAPGYVQPLRLLYEAHKLLETGRWPARPLTLDEIYAFQVCEQVRGQFQHDPGYARMLPRLHELVDTIGHKLYCHDPTQFLLLRLKEGRLVNLVLLDFLVDKDDGRAYLDARELVVFLGEYGALVDDIVDAWHDARQTDVPTYVTRRLAHMVEGGVPASHTNVRRVRRELYGEMRRLENRAAKHPRQSPLGQAIEKYKWLFDAYLHLRLGFESP